MRARNLSRKAVKQYLDKGEVAKTIVTIWCKCVVDNTILHRDVYCEAFLSGVRRRLGDVNVHSIPNSNQFQIVRRNDFPFRILHFQSRGLSAASIPTLT